MIFQGVGGSDLLPHPPSGSEHGFERMLFSSQRLMENYGIKELVILCKMVELSGFNIITVLMNRLVTSFAGRLHLYDTYT